MALRQSLRDLVEESRRLRTDVRDDQARRERENRRRRQENMISIGLGLMLLACMLVVGVVAIQNQRISQQISDCTTAGGQCHEEGQRRTGKAVGDIIKGNVYIHECLKITDTDPELEKCVAARLAAD